MFKYNAKPFVDSDNDDDSNDGDQLFNSLNSKKAADSDGSSDECNRKRKKSAVMKTNKSNKLSKSVTKTSKSNAVVSIDSSDDDVESESIVNSKKVQLLPEPIYYVDDSTDVSLLQDESIIKAKSLLKMVVAQNKKTTSKKIDIDNTVEVESYTISESQSNSLISSIYIPKVKSAKERKQVYNKSNDVSLEYLNNIMGVSNEQEFAASSVATGISSIKLKTRLNGKHEFLWKIAKTDNFLKMKTKFAEVYGITAKSIKFIFDGQPLKDSETADDIDMEDDNMIDVKIPIDMYSNAVIHADNLLKNRAGGSSNADNSNAAGLLKIKTRVNGKHEWKWKISPSDAFSKMKTKFCEIYGGLPAKSVKFVFDGEVLKETQTADDLDMEDDNIIDVKIPSELYDAAIKSAEKASKPC